ncbi:proline-rich receptor-like protein kinase PERK10 [Enhydra lutris kenyoni]|uniref:Proline-rich receptor-like protein kinase PERK10 n=1 Tax=Enhydra lutris kenyoni TaxID=391180 RepID=A0A2Y9JI20_ENHLU|nr:proline-rich receptor-like protein kinase PERK10 [Enhydra lutris kenyoni]
MKKESGGRITSLTLEKKGGWEGGREREGVARRCDGKRCGSGSGGIRRADGGGPANWKAAESRVSQRRAVAAAPLLIAPGAAAGGGWIQRPWRRLWRRQLPSDPRQRILDCSPYAGDMGTRQPLPSPGAPSPVRGTSAAALPPLASARCPLRKSPRFAPSPEPSPSAQPPSSSPLTLPPPTRPPPPSSPTQPYTAQRPATRVTGVWESPSEVRARLLRLRSRSQSRANHRRLLFATPPGKSRST